VAGVTGGGATSGGVTCSGQVGRDKTAQVELKSERVTRPGLRCAPRPKLTTAAAPSTTNRRRGRVSRGKLNFPPTSELNPPPGISRRGEAGGLRVAPSRRRERGRSGRRDWWLGECALTRRADCSRSCRAVERAGGGVEGRSLWRAGPVVRGGSPQRRHGGALSKTG